MDTTALTAIAADLELLVLGRPTGAPPAPCLPARPAFGSSPEAAELSAAAVVTVERAVEADVLLGRLLAASVDALTRAVRVLDEDGTAPPPTGGPR